jgi:hypothetical protein
MQKSAVGHNVPIVGGFAPFCETLLPNGHWWPQPYANATAVMTVEPSEITLSHDGFARATLVTRHTRRIHLGKQFLEVIDRFEGDGVLDVVFCWHFGSEFQTLDNDSLVAKSKSSQVLIELVDSDTRQPIVHALCETDALQESTSYGQSIPTLGLRLNVVTPLPAQIMTRFTVSSCAA